MQRARRGESWGWISVALGCATVVLGWAAASQAAGPVWVTKLCARIPRTEEELAAEHAGSRNSCIQVPVGDPLEVRDFTEPTVYDISVTKGGEKQRLKLEYDLCRLNAMTIGLRIPPEEESQLPAVSKPSIRRRLNHNYIAIQARVHRDREHSQTYVYFKPFACVGRYGNLEATHEFSPLMEDSVRDMRAIGLFVPEGEKPSAEQLRTLVCVNRDQMMLPDAQGQVTSQVHYELVFVRARVEGNQVTLHSFVTNEYRRRLHYLQPADAPADRRSCSMVHTLRFTEYTAAKQSPSAKVTLEVTFNSRGYWELNALDRWVADAGLKGDAYDHVTQVLDAIIDGKIPADGAPETNVESAGELPAVTDTEENDAASEDAGAAAGEVTAPVPATP